MKLGVEKAIRELKTGKAAIRDDIIAEPQDENGVTPIHELMSNQIDMSRRIPNYMNESQQITEEGTSDSKTTRRSRIRRSGIRRSGIRRSRIRRSRIRRSGIRRSRIRRSRIRRSRIRRGIFTNRNALTSRRLYKFA